jgi:hypothetical protein
LGGSGGVIAALEAASLVASDAVGDFSTGGGVCASESFGALTITGGRAAGAVALRSEKEFPIGGRGAVGLVLEADWRKLSASCLALHPPQKNIPAIASKRTDRNKIAFLMESSQILIFRTRRGKDCLKKEDLTPEQLFR